MNVWYKCYNCEATTQYLEAATTGCRECGQTKAPNLSTHDLRNYTEGLWLAASALGDQHETITRTAAAELFYMDARGQLCLDIANYLNTLEANGENR